MAAIYKQAHDLVLQKYQEEPEDHWKLGAIARAREGEKGHESTMFQFVKDIEMQVDALLKSNPIVTESPNKKDITTPAEPFIKPATPP